MKPPELLENLNKLDLRGKPLELCNLKLTTVPYQQAAEVKKALEDFQPQQGWLCFQDSIKHFNHGRLPDEGVILYGEVKAKNKALHIQAGNTGGWLLTTYEEQKGETHLVELTQLLGEFDDPGNLAYRVYWENDEEQGYRPTCAAFAGFTQKKENNKK